MQADPRPRRRPTRERVVSARGAAGRSRRCSTRAVTFPNLPAGPEVRKTGGRRRMSPRNRLGAQCAGSDAEPKKIRTVADQAGPGDAAARVVRRHAARAPNWPSARRRRNRPLTLLRMRRRRPHRRRSAGAAQPVDAAVSTAPFPARDRRSRQVPHCRRLCRAGDLAAQRGGCAGRLPSRCRPSSQPSWRPPADDPPGRSRRQGHLLPRAGRSVREPEEAIDFCSSLKAAGGHASSRRINGAELDPCLRKRLSRADGGARIHHGLVGHRHRRRTSAAFLREADPWGLILFKRNIDDPAQVDGPDGEISRHLGRDAPVLVDQEGGRVQRLGPPHWPAYPPGAAYGRCTTATPAPGSRRHGWAAG